MWKLDEWFLLQDAVHLYFSGDCYRHSNGIPWVKWRCSNKWKTEQRYSYIVLNATSSFSTELAPTGLSFTWTIVPQSTGSAHLGHLRISEKSWGVDPRIFSQIFGMFKLSCLYKNYWTLTIVTLELCFYSSMRRNIKFLRRHS